MAKSNPERDCKIDAFCFTCGQYLPAGGKVKMSDSFKNNYSAYFNDNVYEADWAPK